MNRLLLLMITCFAAFASTAWAERRVALVIGNANYEHVTPLKNPLNDAKLIAESLRHSGFEVVTVTDLDWKAMKTALVEFGRTLKGGVDASVFYYAGHGVQTSGENYLVPIDADLKSEDEVGLQAFAVNDFLQTMENSSSKINIVILDACRNNPFRSFRSTRGGLAGVVAPRGTYIAYATAPGRVAADGDADNSPYTLALSQAMQQPGMKLEDVFKKARELVLVATRDEQVPWESSSITGDFYFGKLAIDLVVEKSNFVEVDRIAAEWDAAKASKSQVVLRAFKEKYASDSVYSALADELIKELDKGSASPKLPILPVADTVIEIGPTKVEPVPTKKAPILKPAKKTVKIAIAKTKDVEKPRKDKIVRSIKPKEEKTVPKTKQKVSRVANAVKSHHGVPVDSAKYIKMTRCESNDPLRQGALCRRSNGTVCNAYFIGDGTTHPRVLRNCD